MQELTFPVEWLAFNQVGGVKVHHLVGCDDDALLYGALFDLFEGLARPVRDR